MKVGSTLAILLLFLLACSKKPEPIGAKNRAEPEPDPEGFDLGPKTFRIHPSARIFLRASILPEEISEHAGFARDLGVHKIEVVTLDWEEENEIQLNWQLKERYKAKGRPEEAVAKGSIQVSPWSQAVEMILPVRWRKEMKLGERALLWLTPRAFRELKEKKETEWRVHAGVQAKREAVLRVKETGERPVRVNGKERWVNVLFAETAVAKFMILDNKANPLILSVTLKEGMAKEEELRSDSKRTEMTYRFAVTEVWIVE